MAAVIVPVDETQELNNTTSDGGQYEFVFITPTNTIMANTRTEVVAALIDAEGGGRGYLDIAAGERGKELTTWLRHEAANALASSLAEAILITAAQTGVVPPHDIDEDLLNLIVAPDRGQPTFQPFTGEWKDERVPLILNRADYTPFTALPLPTGNVQFIDPSNETTFLDSLVHAGLGELYTIDEAA